MAPVAPPLVNHTAAEMLEFAHNINVPRAIAALSEEARQIEDVIGVVEQTVSDPQTSLGEAMRLSNWSKQLEAYLRGIRFALGETESLCTRETTDSVKSHGKHEN